MAALPTSVGPVQSIAGQARVPYCALTAGTLTYLDRYGKEVRLYDWKEGATWMEIPRGLADLHTLDPKNDYRVEHPMGAINCAKGPRYEDNARCLKESLDLLRAGVSHITEAPTGWGKTYHGCAVAAGLGEATLIVVTKNDLIDGWHKTLLGLIGVDPSQIGHCQQKVCTFKGKRFVVAMVQSLLSREYDPEFYKHFGLVIFDEVHRLGADYFQQVCKLFPARYRLGLSATPKRADGRLKTFASHIGDIMVRGVNIPMSPKIIVKHTGWKVPSYPQFDPEKGEKVMKEMPMVPGQLGAVLKRLCADDARNAEIAEFVKTAYDAGRTIVVMSDLIDGHLVKLFAACGKAGVPGHHMDYYIGGRSKAELEAAKKARVVFATFAFTSEGTDVPHWDTLVLATPKANVAQAVGRVIRFVEGKKQPVVLDLVDNHKLFQGFHNSRLVNYYKINSTILKV